MDGASLLHPFPATMRTMTFYDLAQFGKQMRPTPDPVTEHFEVDTLIEWAFLILLWLICLLHVFSKLGAINVDIVSAIALALWLVTAGR